MSLVVVVTGPPAGGKTTIAERLADEFSLPLIAKDGIKETLFDTLGSGDIEWSKRLGVASFALIWHALEREARAGRSVIVEGNFPRRHAGRVLSLHERYRFDVVQLVCHAPEGELRRRYLSRNRHPGHHDRERSGALLLDPDDYRLPLDGPLVDLDTTRGDAYRRARSAVAAVLQPEEAP
jgi:predicted kinase